MKKLIFALLFFIGITHAFAEKINRMIFFGDSLSDNGNLYSLLLHLIPKSPPYFQGRFSNGPTWAEVLGNHYALKNSHTYKIYAVGGATAVYHPPSSKFITLTTLQMEIDHYLLDERTKNKEKTLFAIWIGGNDYLFNPSKNIEKDTDKVVNKIIWAIEKINQFGGNHFLILNLPDLEQIPNLASMIQRNQLHLYSILHNEKLNKGIESLKEKHPKLDITTINIYDIFQDVIQDPEKYNKKYHVNIVNTTNACWEGGLSKNIVAKNRRAEIQSALKKFSSDYDEDALNRLFNSPLLRYSEEMGVAFAQMIRLPCENPDEYIFWDFIHPTAMVHNLLARMIIEKMDSPV